jgi:hypothetical protein
MINCSVVNHKYQNDDEHPHPGAYIKEDLRIQFEYAGHSSDLILLARRLDIREHITLALEVEDGPVYGVNIYATIGRYNARFYINRSGQQNDPWARITLGWHGEVVGDDAEEFEFFGGGLYPGLEFNPDDLSSARPGGVDRPIKGPEISE